MLRVKISTLGHLAKNLNALAPIMSISGLGNGEGIEEGSSKRSEIIMELGILDLVTISSISSIDI